MDFEAAFALIAATLILVAVPGPNVALIVSTTIARGFASGAMTVLGTTLGTACQLAVVVLGFAVVLNVATVAFVWLKWLGALYLVALGLWMWRLGVEPAKRFDEDRGAAGVVHSRAAGMPTIGEAGSGYARSASLPRRHTVSLAQGLLLAVINPKTLLFNAAFLPQFVRSDAGTDALYLAGLLYLAVMFAGDLLWVTFAGWARPMISGLGRWRHRITGGLLIGAGMTLALTRIQRP